MIGMLVRLKLCCIRRVSPTRLVGGFYATPRVRSSFLSAKEAKRRRLCVTEEKMEKDEWKGSF